MKKRIIALFAVILLIPCLAFAASASAFTPSVQAKDAPKLVAKQTGSGAFYGELLDKDGKTTNQITNNGTVIITPLSQADSSGSDTKNSLKSAYDKIKGTTSLSDLINGLVNSINNLDPDFSVKDLVARDLFNITAKDTQITENNKLRVTFDLGISATDPVIFAMCNGDKNWRAIDSKNVVNNGDGTVTVTFSETGTVLVVIEGDSAATVPGMSSSGELGLAAVITGGCMIALIISIVFFDRKKAVSRKS
jgi:hypothetical protein